MLIPVLLFIVGLLCLIKGGDGFVFTTGERNVEVSDVAETVEDIRQTAKGLKDSLREMFRRKPSEEE